MNSLIKKMVIINFVLGVAILLNACGKSEAVDDKAESNKIDKTSDKSINVHVAEIKQTQFIEYISVTGVVKPFASSKVSAAEGGLIEEFFKNKGAYVKKGELIARLKNDVQKAAMEAAFAQYQLSDANFQRQEEVFNKQINSEIQYLNAKFNRDAAKANYELAKAHYENTFIKNPISGYIDHKFLELGEMATPGMPIVNVVDVTNIKISAGVAERYLRDIKLGSNANISFSIFPGEKFKGRVSYVSPSVNVDNRTFEIEILMSNPSSKLKPEIVADMNIQKSKYDKAIVINQSFITSSDLGQVVFIEKDGLVEMKKITIGAKSGNEVMITNGLEVGDRLITVGYQDVVQGEKVNVVK